MTALVLEPHNRRRWRARAERRAVELLEAAGITDAIVPVVYGLTDEDGTIRYVGACEHGLGYRLTRHLDYAERGKEWRVSRWLREVDYHIGVVVLAVDPPDPRAVELEWIHRLLADGVAITNYCGTPTTEVQKRAATEANNRRFSDPAERAKIGERARNQVITEETRAKLSAAMTGKRHTPEARAKMSAARKGIPKSEATKANMRAAWARRKGVV